MKRCERSVIFGKTVGGKGAYDMNELLPHGWSDRSAKQVVAIVILVLMTMTLSFIEFPVAPQAHWLKYDPSGIVPLLVTLLYGPAVGVGVAVLAWVPHLIVSPIGSLMNICSTTILLLLMSAVYRRRPSLSRAILGAALGVAAVVAIMSCLNMAITPLVVNDVTYQDVTSLVPAAVAPFNLGKATVNAAITLATYRPLGRLLES